ncbi:hypothetical protein [Kutzneria sp. 744]|uniref:helix-hairpin-helix domain-containing protein n=1 Tax=Kutzneria sp. (strain 744) TaxID=345341 RepID=UPI00350FE025
MAHATLEPCGATSAVRAVRLGIGAIRAIGTDLADRVVAERDTNGQYTSMVDLARRTRMTTPQLEALATAGGIRRIRHGPAAGIVGSGRRGPGSAGPVARDHNGHGRTDAARHGQDRDRRRRRVGNGNLPTATRSSSSGHAWTSSESSRSHACPQRSMANGRWWPARSPTDRRRHLPTVCGQMPNSVATSVLDLPSAQPSTMRHRSTNICDDFARWDQRVSVSRSSSVNTTAAAGRPRPAIHRSYNSSTNFELGTLVSCAGNSMTKSSLGGWRGLDDRRSSWC